MVYFNVVNTKTNEVAIEKTSLEDAVTLMVVLGKDYKVTRAED